MLVSDIAMKSKHKNWGCIQIGNMRKRKLRMIRFWRHYTLFTSTPSIIKLDLSSLAWSASLICLTVSWSVHWLARLYNQNSLWEKPYRYMSTLIFRFAYMSNILAQPVCTVRHPVCTILLCTLAAGAHLEPHRSWDMGGWKDPLMMDPNNKNGVNLMPITRWSMAHKFNNFILKKKKITLDPTVKSIW